MRSPKSFIRKARLNPEAKKPPNGAINEAKTPFKVLYLQSETVITVIKTYREPKWFKTSRYKTILKQRYEIGMVE